MFENITLTFLQYTSNLTLTSPTKEVDVIIKKAENICLIKQNYFQ